MSNKKQRKEKERKKKKQNQKKKKTHWQCRLFADSVTEEYVAEYKH